MARVVIVGGGVVGLCGALLLARDDHDVTVLERDPAPVPPSPSDAWQLWQRRSVNQFRHLHFFLPRFRAMLEAELPDVAGALTNAGALRFNPIKAIPAERTGGVRETDSRFDTLTGRRPMVEATVAAVAERQPGLSVRRGAAVIGLRTQPDHQVPEVTGVALDDGEVVDADVVIDAGGRRSPMTALLVDAGAGPPLEERHDFGFVYYARHFRSDDETVPVPFGPLLQPCGSVSLLTLPADNGNWGVGIVTSARDQAARSLRDVDVWERVVQAFPLVAHWTAGECVSDGVEVMARIEDRYRHFCIDGRPVASGVLPLGDAYACTNPSLGRGVAIGLMQAVALRKLLRSGDVGDRYAMSCQWDEMSANTVGPYLYDTLAFDGHRLAEIEAEMAGETYETSDRGYHLGRALSASAFLDADLLRMYLEVVSVHARGNEVLSRPGVAERAMALAGGGTGPLPYVGPDRSALVELLSSGVGA